MKIAESCTFLLAVAGLPDSTSHKWPLVRYFTAARQTIHSGEHNARKSAPALLWPQPGDQIVAHLLVDAQFSVRPFAEPQLLQHPNQVIARHVRVELDRLEGRVVVASSHGAASEIGRVVERRRALVETLLFSDSLVDSRPCWRISASWFRRIAEQTGGLPAMDLTAFPAPVKLGKSRRWRLSEIVAFERELSGLAPVEFDPDQDKWIDAKQVKARLHVSDTWLWRRQVCRRAATQTPEAA
jgi:hypothetical protein